MREEIQQADTLGGNNTVHPGTENNGEQERLQRRMYTTERARLRAMIRSASSDRRLIVVGMEGATVAVPLRRARDGASGTIIVRVVCVGREPHVQVIGSDYAPIRSHHGNLILPVFALFRTEFPRNELDRESLHHFGTELHELWEALTWACAQSIAEYKQSQKQQTTAPIETEATETDSVPLFERRLAVSLTGKDLMVKPRFWKSLYFFSAHGLHKAYYRREMVDGVRTLSLIDVDEGHVLSRVLRVHREVRVKIDDIILPKWGSIKISDIADRTEAEKCVAKHINSLLPSMGFAPRPHHMKKGVTLE